MRNLFNLISSLLLIYLNCCNPRVAATTQMIIDGTQIGFENSTITPENKSIPPDSIIIRNLGNEMMSIIFNPDSVKGFTLNPLQSMDSTTERFENFAIKSKPVSINKDNLNLLKAILCDSASYKFDVFISKHVFEPDYAFEFVRKKDKVIVFICFACNEFGFKFKGKLRRDEFVCNNQLKKLMELTFK